MSLQINIAQTNSISNIESTFTPITIPEKIVFYTRKWNVDTDLMISIIQCESRWNPNAHNKSDPDGGSKGFLQFQTKTFLKYAKEIKIKNPDIWDIDQQLDVASYMFSKNQQKQWSCFYKVHK